MSAYPDSRTGGRSWASIAREVVSGRHRPAARTHNNTSLYCEIRPAVKGARALHACGSSDIAHVLPQPGSWRNATAAAIILRGAVPYRGRSEEHTSELQSRG